MEKIDKAYNTHLIALWLDNNQDNYYACGDMNEKKFMAIMKNDATLNTWLHYRYFGGDADKISLNPKDYHASIIRHHIEDNMNAVNA